MKPIIEVKNIGKKYTLNHTKGGYIALRDVLMDVITSPFSFLKRKVQSKEIFWALDNINFSVQKGEVIGIIGHNGAGKSTLLKILSQITSPTTGEIMINGTVGSLLEVGTGFHPELTGRENIFLNGAILGMKKSDISKKFDDIVSFAGVEQFLDTPVKYYSSGMYVRLAFSVAAHMDTDILIIDEVLAVGDTEFQKKCLGKMSEITKTEGRTILFVSHNMGAIKQLCNKTLLLKNGELINFDATNKVISEYTQKTYSRSSEVWQNTNEQHSNKYFKPTKFFITREGSDLFLNIDCEIESFSPDLTFGYAIYTQDNILLGWSYQTDTNQEWWPKIKNGKNSLRTLLPFEILNSGLYKIELIASLYFKEWIIEPNKNNPTLYIKYEKDFSHSKYWKQSRPGLLTISNKWELLN